MNMKISLFGTGMYGLAIAMELAKKEKNEIVMWTESIEKEEEYKKTGSIKSIYDIKLPKNIKITASVEEAMENADIIFITCASKYVDNVTKKIRPYFKSKMHICIASKGIDEQRQELLSNIVKDNLDTSKISVISGPTFAVDMLNNNPVALAIASLNKKTRNIIIDVLANENLKLRPTSDIIGIQICGSVKNCVAIASGILYGLGYTESTQAFLINESLHDIKKIIKYMGGKSKTILSFAGVGDLTLTCSSKKSRNFSFGYVIGSTKDKDKIKEYLDNNTVEGYYSISLVNRLLKKKNIDIPLIKVIYNIVYKGSNPDNLVKFLIEKE